MIRVTLLLRLYQDTIILTTLFFLFSNVKLDTLSINFKPDEFPIFKLYRSRLKDLSYFERTGPFLLQFSFK